MYLSPAWNQGARETTAPWLLFLNPDTEWFRARSPTSWLLPVVRALGPTAIPTLTIAEPLASIAQIVAAQSFALHLAEAKGVDPERPRHLWKVTATRSRRGGGSTSKPPPDAAQ